MSETIHCAAMLGDVQAVRRFLAMDAKLATLKGGAKGWDPLTHLCFSEHLRQDRSRAAVFLDWKDWRSPESVAALLAAGASIDGLDFPTGYAEIDALLVRAR